MHEDAQAFFIAAGGPERDPHRLDGNKDRIACESLPSSENTANAKRSN
jgi:micrococcal nuclease